MNTKVEELKAERDRYQAKIDGPENDGRVTVSGSMDLDYWFDTVEKLNAKIEAIETSVIKYLF